MIDASSSFERGMLPIGSVGMGMIWWAPNPRLNAGQDGASASGPRERTRVQVVRYFAGWGEVWQYYKNIIASEIFAMVNAVRDVRFALVAKRQMEKLR
jgi:hypothetical protein